MLSDQVGLAHLALASASLAYGKRGDTSLVAYYPARALSPSAIEAIRSKRDTMFV